jgi:hypothetical protein
MAVDANEACTLVDVRLKSVIFDAIGSEKGFTGGIRSTILFVEIMLEIAVVIEPYLVAVVA